MSAENAAKSIGLPIPTVPDRSSTLETARLWALHLLCFVMPLTTLAFALTGPHSAPAALGFLGVITASVLVDNHASGDRRQPARSLPGWPFSGVLYVLASLQVTNVVLVARLVSMTGLWSVDALVGILLLGTTSGYSGIVVAHELMHRPKKHLQLLSRLLMSTVLYEHFFTEHVRGHHARVGTDADAATARHGERYNAFFLRTVPAQFRSAWRLEAKRLGDENMSLSDPRLFRSRVVHGIAFEFGLAVTLGFAFGWAALVVHMLQALTAVRLLEAVNYFEHYGIRRQAKRVRPIDSWDTDSWFTLYTLVGLSRHADHHAFASRPYQKLRYWEESPKLPTGYFGMVWMVMTNNDKFFQLMDAELEKKALGPHAAFEAAGFSRA